MLIGKGPRLYPGLPLTGWTSPRSPPSLSPRPACRSSYDVVVSAGNVMQFVADGTERRVLAPWRPSCGPAGARSSGSHDASYHDDLDRDASRRLAVEHRFATWQRDAWHRGADWAVSVYRG